MAGVITIASIVEGHGEVKALPVLLRRIAAEVYGQHGVAVPQPFRVNRNRMPDRQELARAVRVVSARVSGAGGVLVAADADDDCALELADNLRKAAAPAEVEVAVAVREFEAWFLGAAQSLRRHRAVRADADYHSDPDSRRDAKAALSALMVEQYQETLHQAAFAALIDLEEASRSRSFRHLVGCVGRLLS